ncbi:FecR family protein [Niabella insulamsoli]|uniref:FecR family protein n=1 Tax=Niabella insulamsoli TaxID=3144874 RepID=UPI0031FC199F
MIYSIEQLAIDDSFIQYCFESDEAAVKRWNGYLLEHPEQLMAMQEAKAIVLGLKTMLRKKQNELSAQESEREHLLYVAEYDQIPAMQHPRRGAGFRKWSVAAAMLLISLVSVIFFITQSTAEPQTHLLAAQKIATKTVIHKNLLLPDGTTVRLNIQSQLKVAPEFGISNRDVYLTGEALFDVAHNAALPFVVHVKNYKVKALGTRFNVKDYQDEQLSETSLLEGKVQILFDKKDGEKIYQTLAVNEKFVLKKENDTAEKPEDHAAVQPMAYYEKNKNVETAWAEGLLIFEDWTLNDIKATLERKFDVDIDIRDSEVGNYKYTAAFKDEDIAAVMETLQMSYPFKYTIEGNKIIIGK